MSDQKNDDKRKKADRKPKQLREIINDNMTEDELLDSRRPKKTDKRRQLNN